MRMIEMLMYFLCCFFSGEFLFGVADDEVRFEEPLRAWQRWNLLDKKGREEEEEEVICLLNCYKI